MGEASVTLVQPVGLGLLPHICDKGWKRISPMVCVSPQLSGGFTYPPIVASCTARSHQWITLSAAHTGASPPTGARIALQGANTSVVVVFGWLTVVTPQHGAWSASPGTVITSPQGDLCVSPRAITDYALLLLLEWDGHPPNMLSAASLLLARSLPTPNFEVPDPPILMSVARCASHLGHYQPTEIPSEILRRLRQRTQEGHLHPLDRVCDPGLWVSDEAVHMAQAFTTALAPWVYQRHDSRWLASLGENLQTAGSASYLADFVSRGGRLVHHVANEGESHWVLHVGALRSCPCLFRADPYHRPEVSTAQVEGIPELTWDTADDGGIAAVQVLAQLREAWAQQPLANTKDCAVSAWITSLAAAMGAERNGGPVGPNDRWTMARVLLCMTLGPRVETPPVLSLTENVLRALPHDEPQQVFKVPHNLGAPDARVQEAMALVFFSRSGSELLPSLPIKDMMANVMKQHRHGIQPWEQKAETWFTIVHKEMGDFGVQRPATQNIRVSTLAETVLIKLEGQSLEWLSLSRDQVVMHRDTGPLCFRRMPSIASSLASRGAYQYTPKTPTQASQVYTEVASLPRTPELSKWHTEPHLRWEDRYADVIAAARLGSAVSVKELQDAGDVVDTRRPIATLALCLLGDKRWE